MCMKDTYYNFIMGKQLRITTVCGSFQGQLVHRSHQTYLVPQRLQAAGHHRVGIGLL